ncbi:hypothetical protein ACTORR_13065 [Pseudomonas sp. SAR267]|uniref:hypothetical protein n=1 Tax=Pseudomonas sp. SAR267 TaxID=3454502 RepID=UPI003F90A22F
MHYLIDGQPVYCPQCGKPIAPRLSGWEAQDRFHNGDHPFSCDCNARYLVAKQAVNSAFDDGEAEDGSTDRRRKAETELLSELYVILGELDAPASVLEQVLAAIDGEDLPHPTLIPFERDQ